jgi:hypothetical protein
MLTTGIKQQQGQQQQLSAFTYADVGMLTDRACLL